jgi:membrane-bound lytic murein transglycosylase A
VHAWVGASVGASFGACGPVRVPAFRRGLAVAILLPLVLAGGCRAPSAPDRSLHPPEGATTHAFLRLAPADEARVLDRAAKSFAALDASARREAIEMASRAGDPEVREMADLLREIAGRLDGGAGGDACADRFRAAFRVLAPSAADGTHSDALVTGYATPRVRASRAADELHTLPILGDLRAVDRDLAAQPRRAILGDPRTMAQAIAWIADPLDWALVETNGTAELVLDDGETLRVSRIATNGRAFTSLGRALAARGALAAPFDLDDVREAARVDPALARAATIDNERVVFFAAVARERFPPALGVEGRLLAGLSCAADQSAHPPGSMLFLETGDGAGERRGARDEPRLAFVHDAGGAIRGPSRVDLYFGSGPEAVAEAGRCRREGRVLRLAPRRDG